MSKLKVALIIKGTEHTRRRDDRNVGLWSYPVDEFEWTHKKPGSTKQRASSYRDFDIIFHEDGGNWIRWLDKKGPPIIYYSIDSTLSYEHYKERYEQGKRSDLILLDQDNPSRFVSTGTPVEMLNYCVNDRLFSPREKKYDVSMLYAKGKLGSQERQVLSQFLQMESKSNGWTWVTGGRKLPKYAEIMGESRISISHPRVFGNRPHRTFDAMACRSMLITGMLPIIRGDLINAGIDYAYYKNASTIPETIHTALAYGQWEEYAERGYRKVIENHTWEIRAKQLREIISHEFGI